MSWIDDVMAPLEELGVTAGAQSAMTGGSETAMTGGSNTAMAGGSSAALEDDDWFGL